MTDYIEVPAGDLVAGMVVLLNDSDFMFRQLFLEKDVTYSEDNVRGLIQPTFSVRWTGLLSGSMDGEYFEKQTRSCGFGWQRNHHVLVSTESIDRLAE